MVFAASVASALIALAITGALASGGHRLSAARPPVSQSPHVRVAPATTPRPAAAAPATTPRLPARRRSRSAAPPVLASPASLQLSGHELLATGHYEQATVVLTKAMRATGLSTELCLRPVGAGCLVYAYALYDLGRALLLEGEPDAAIAVLQQRLRIDNQQPVVAAALALARGAGAAGNASTPK